MTAFGPYKDKEVIDFTKLHEHGIFVVSGSTGAGKTTIFDAITFALYDAGSGEDREKSLFLRSDFADQVVDTEVELEFEVRNRIYRIWRKFGHDGAGAKREFYDITNGKNEPAVEKFQVKLVQSKVEELIGLTQSQFNQIVMLPQGEFQKLLTSESKHKEEIFRKIFKTERFTKMVEVLREKKRIAEKMFDQSKAQQEHMIYDIKTRLPERQSELFLAINHEVVNMYQVKQALYIEQQYYEQQVKNLSEQYDASKLQYKNLNDTLSEQKLLNDRIENYLKKKAQLVDLTEQEQLIKQQQKRLELAVKASQIEPLEREYEKVKNQLSVAKETFEKSTTSYEQVKQQLEQATQNYREQQKNEPLLDSYTKAISQLEQLLPIYQSIDEQRLSVGKLVENQSKAKVLYNKLQNESNELKEKHQAQQAVIKQIEDEVVAYQLIFEQHAEVTKKVEVATEATKLQQSVTTLKNDFLQKKSLAEDAQNELKQLEQQILSNQAAFLASSLQNGEACPVCGSVEHPAIHNRETLHVDENEVESLRQKADFAMQHYYQVRSKLEVEESAFEVKKSQLQQLDIVLEKANTYEQQKNELANKLIVLKQQQNQLTIEKKTLEQFVNDREVLQSRIEKGQSYVIDIETQLAQEKGKLEQSEKSLLPEFTTVQQVTSELQEQQQKLKYLKETIRSAFETLQKIQLEEKSSEVNLQHAVKQFNDKQQEEILAKIAFETALQQENFDLTSYKQAILSTDLQQKIRQEIEIFKRDLHTLTVQLAEEKPLLEGKSLTDLSVLQQQIVQLNEQVERNYADVKLNESYALQCMETTNKLEQVAEQIESYKEKLMQVEHVYDLIRGQNESKISFERFAQIGYLEKVTHAANERLRILSNGQYFLKSTGRKEGNAQSGLSIDVFDSNTGQTRDVKTLSGGEKFNASLALALGMADVIQSVQGSVHIDTMFIDEGFGTLDEEALQRAIDILIDLQQSGRLIGVISHVAELKSAMPAILQVHKLKEGHSKTEIIVK